MASAEKHMTIYCRRALFGVQVKLWPGVHCLQCLSFNGSFDIMNEGGPPSVPQREPVVSEPITARRIVFFVLFNEVNSHTRGRNSSRPQDDVLKRPRNLNDMAGFPPPGFGNSGKCFLIENLLSSPAPGVRALGLMVKARCQTPSGNTT